MMRHQISLAPMMGKTERDWRRIMRFITRESLLFTPMISAAAILRGKRDRLLAFDPAERPLVLQLGWDEAAALAECCKIAEDYGYDEINLNCGCPSSRVQKHNFGACMMANPEHVASLVDAMVNATASIISVKCRVGIRLRSAGGNIGSDYARKDIQRATLRLEDYEDLRRFVDVVSRAGCSKFTVHARTAILEDLNPKENRNIPPLRYEDVYQLKVDFPHLFVEINGGFRNLADIDAALRRVDAVMLGRIALDNPYMLSRVDAYVSGSKEAPLSRRDIFEMAAPYIARRVEQGIPRGVLIAPLLNLYKGRPGARTSRRLLSRALSCPLKDFIRFLRNAIPD